MSHAPVMSKHLSCHCTSEPKAPRLLGVLRLLTTHLLELVLDMLSSLMVMLTIARDHVDLQIKGIQEYLFTQWILTMICVS